MAKPPPFYFFLQKRAVKVFRERCFSLSLVFLGLSVHFLPLFVYHKKKTDK